jgi:predicted restriction endonuclease
VTGCTVSSILKASHIKAWAISSPIERLDPFNGLLLSPNLDALFDSGLITFEDDGSLVISPRISEEDKTSLGLTEKMKLRKVNGAHKAYLLHHRENNFRGKS